MSRQSEHWETVQDMARRYRISEDSVRRKVKNDEWPCDRIGRLYRFSPEQQEQIQQIVAGNTDTGLDKNRIAEALRKLTA